MQERYIPNQPELTGRVQNPYARYMADAPPVDRPLRVEERTRQLNPEEVREYWRRFERSRGDLTDEQRRLREQNERGERSLEAKVNERDEFQIPGVDANRIDDDTVLQRIRYVNLMHDNNASDDRGVSETVKELMGMVGNRQAQDAARRIGHYLGRIRAEHAKSRPDRTDPENYFNSDEIHAIETDEVERDKIFNSLFARADAIPNLEFQTAFGVFDDQPRYKAFIDVLQRAGKNDIANEYAEEQATREVLHNINYAVVRNIPADKFASFAGSMRDEQGELAFKKKGVSHMMHFFEQAMLKVMAENNGYLPAVAMANIGTDGGLNGRVEYLAKTYLKEGLRQETLLDTDGRPLRMDEWEINRAISFARSMGLVFGRTIEIAASSKLPENATLVSLYAQQIIKQMAPYRHIMGKFNAGIEKARILLYKLNNEDSSWDIKELADISGEDIRRILNGVVLADDEGEERHLAELNPFRIGGMLSKTGWRYGENPEASVTGAMLVEDRYNPLIGSGLWIEKERGNLGSKDKLKARDGLTDIDSEVVYGQVVHNAGEKAEVIIRYHLNLIAQNSPLKLFFNNEKVQQAVTRRLFNAGVYEGVQEPEDLIKNAQFRQDLDKIVQAQEYVNSARQAGQELSLEDALARVVEVEGDRNRIRGIIDNTRDVFLNAPPGGRSIMDSFMSDLQNRDYRIPFIFGAEDIPYNKLLWSRAGGNSIQRRWNDFGGAVKATEGLGNLIKLMDKLKVHNAEDKVRAMEKLAEAIRAIYDGVSDYDEGVARKVSMRIAEGVGKFFKKGDVDKLPFGLGTLHTIGNQLAGHPQASYAQLVFGSEAMAWDEGDMEMYASILHAQGMFSSHEAFNEFKKKMGATQVDVFKGAIRTIGPLIAIVLLLYFLKEGARQGSK